MTPKLCLFFVVLVSVFVSCTSEPPNPNTYDWTQYPNGYYYSKGDDNNLANLPTFVCNVPNQGVCRQGRVYEVGVQNLRNGFINFKNAYDRDSIIDYFNSNDWKNFFDERDLTPQMRSGILNNYYKVLIDPDSTVVVYQNDYNIHQNVLFVWQWNK